GREPQADGRVVVARREHDLGPRVHDAGHRLGEELDGPGAGQGAVVDVAADEDRVDPLRADQLDEVVDVAGLGGEHPHTVERASYVPVGGGDQSHASEARAT